jgi:hypothetical protein
MQFIELGMLQYAIITPYHADFPDGNRWLWAGAPLPERPGTWQNYLLQDTWTGDPPWYNEDNNPTRTPGASNPLPNEVSYWTDPTLTDPILAPLIVGLADTPSLVFPKQVQLWPNAFDWIEAEALTVSFKVYLAVRTLDPAFNNGADERYIQRAFGSWRFDAYGTFTHPGNQHTWTSTGSGNSIVIPMAEVQDGASIVITYPPAGNSVLGSPTAPGVWVGDAGASGAISQ